VQTEGYYYFDVKDIIRHCPFPHNYGSYNWVNDDRLTEPKLGEVTPTSTTSRPYLLGEAPDPDPEAQFHGDIACLADGDEIAGDDVPYTMWGHIPSLWLPKVRSPFGSGLAAWYKPETLPWGAPGTLIERWPDSSGLGRDLVQFNAANQPLLFYYGLLARQRGPLIGGIHWLDFEELLGTTRNFSIYFAAFLTGNEMSQATSPVAFRTTNANPGGVFAEGARIGYSRGTFGATTLIQPVRYNANAIVWFRRKGRYIEQAWDGVAQEDFRSPASVNLCLEFRRVESDIDIGLLPCILKEALIFNDFTEGKTHEKIMEYLRSRY